jgi:hypothetical protein
MTKMASHLDALGGGAFALAKALPPDTQIDLGLRIPVAYPNDPMGKDLNHKREENFWPNAAQENMGRRTSVLEWRHG